MLVGPLWRGRWWRGPAVEGVLMSEELVLVDTATLRDAIRDLRAGAGAVNAVGADLAACAFSSRTAGREYGAEGTAVQVGIARLAAEVARLAEHVISTADRVPAASAGLDGPDEDLADQLRAVRW